MIFKSLILIVALSSPLMPASAAESSSSKAPQWSSGYDTVSNTFERVGTIARLEFAQRAGMSGMRSDGGMKRANLIFSTDTRLSPLVTESCNRNRKTFFRKNFRWLRKHTVNTGLRFRSDISKNKDHFEPYEAMLKGYEGTPQASAFLAPGQSLYQSYADPKLDIRQRVQWNVLVSQLLNDTVEKHEKNHKDHDTGYALLVLAQARCEITYENSLAIQNYLAANGLSADSQKDARMTALTHAMQ